MPSISQECEECASGSSSDSTIWSATLGSSISPNGWLPQQLAFVFLLSILTLLLPIYG